MRGKQNALPVACVCETLCREVATGIVGTNRKGRQVFAKARKGLSLADLLQLRSRQDSV